MFTKDTIVCRKVHQIVAVCFISLKLLILKNIIDATKKTQAKAAGIQLPNRAKIVDGPGAGNGTSITP